MNESRRRVWQRAEIGEGSLDAASQLLLPAGCILRLRRGHGSAGKLGDIRGVQRHRLFRPRCSAMILAASTFTP